MIRDVDRRSVGLPNEYYQRICCLPIECDPTKCGPDEIPGPSMFIRIPQIESIPNNPSYIGTSDMRKPYRRIPYGQITTWTGGSFGSSGAYALLGGRAYIINPKGISPESLCMQAVLSDPMDAFGCVQLGENDPYPVPQNSVHKLELLAIQQLRSSISIKADEENDSRDSQLDRKTQER